MLLRTRREKTSSYKPLSVRFTGELSSFPESLTLLFHLPDGFFEGQQVLFTALYSLQGLVRSPEILKIFERLQKPFILFDVQDHANTFPGFINHVSGTH